MSVKNTYKLLFITDKGSKFDAALPTITGLFTHVDVSYFDDNISVRQDCNIVIGDLSVDPEKVGVLNELKESNPQAVIFAMVDPKDTEKLFKIADMGINAFELLPEQFDMALQEIVQFASDTNQG